MIPIEQSYPTNRPAPFEWTPERVEEVKELIVAGKSAREIAGILSQRHDARVTRNSVIGCHYRHIRNRGGFTGFTGFTVEKTEPKPKVPSIRTGLSEAERHRRAEKRAAEAEARRRMEEICASTSGTVALVDLKDDMCRYIPGNNHLYCGEITSGETAYCAAHRVMMRRSA